MQDKDERRGTFGPGDYAAATGRLEPGQVYLDLNNPGRGPFVATGDEEVGPESNFVAERDMDPNAWRDLVKQGLAVHPGGSGHFAHDPGAFGTANDPRSDVINAGPPGVGEGLTPMEGEDEEPRK